MQTQNIRRKFLEYFNNKGHSIIPSSPVIPHDDPTLLFTNAGMNQFKDVFLGQSQRDYKRATTTQKCIRVGGKHNDLENVGHTSRHLTFFEMLGNFSFGDYFKKDAIDFAWEVSTNIFGFDADRIWPTVFREDDEAFELWTRYVPAQRITRFDEADNFWAMGDTGPCGPCSELLYDRGSNFSNAAKPSEDKTGERFLEFWNLVFMQYNRISPSEIIALPNPSIDTGAGLERVVSLKMGVDSLFETDVLRALINRVEEVSGSTYNPNDPLLAPAFRVIADHLRCLSFAIADGVQPSNVDRGYVLRKVLRRAVRYGRLLGMQKPFLADVLPRLTELMGEDFKELQTSQDRIAEILFTEEEAFLRTLKRGGNILSQVMESAAQHNKIISGDDAFKLKDTYGFPIEEILLLAKDSDLAVDSKRYQDLEEEAKERSRKVHKVHDQIAEENLFANYIAQHGSTNFLGYEHQQTTAAIRAIVINGAFADTLQEGQKGIVVLDKTPFYAEMGGQIGDSGTIYGDEMLFAVEDCIAPYKGIIAHFGTLKKGSLQVGDNVTAAIDAFRRQHINNNHTATHLLHYALQEILGKHIKQAGSVVDDKRLRFDFNHHKAVSRTELRKIEDAVNNLITQNIAVKWYEIPFTDAVQREEIKQFFGEKYGNMVRVVDIGGISLELCGGTHVNALGVIGNFHISKESSIAAGIRRIEAVTGPETTAAFRAIEDDIEEIANLLKVPQTKVIERLKAMLEENKNNEQQLKNLKKASLKSTVNTILASKESIAGNEVILLEIDSSHEDLKNLADDVMDKLSSGLLVLAAKAGSDKCHIIARASNDLVQQGIRADAIIKAITQIIEGTGGGKPISAQAGGKAPHKINDALTAVRKMLQTQ